ncbi:Rnt1p [Sugiyamaella lignohabitans]|uniref:Rnt1p n=1 Tax=Sugiyamaella lignohabitans TaxID=796027 RepID=A0A167CRI4_9ASCO|nr:Rnt1p [Sugiyamaella lignohabitans]ANB12022.1 Rnt1p [Sugiyamaella lignohabitans]
MSREFSTKNFFTSIALEIVLKLPENSAEEMLYWPPLTSAYPLKEEEEYERESELVTNGSEVNGLFGDSSDHDGLKNVNGARKADEAGETYEALKIKSKRDKNDRLEVFDKKTNQSKTIRRRGQSEKIRLCGLEKSDGVYDANDVHERAKELEEIVDNGMNYSTQSRSKSTNNESTPTGNLSLRPSRVSDLPSMVTTPLEVLEHGISSNSSNEPKTMDYDGYHIVTSHTNVPESPASPEWKWPPRLPLLSQERVERQVYAQKPLPDSNEFQSLVVSSMFYKNNRRLKYLGKSILDFTMSALIFERFQKATSTEMRIFKKKLLNQRQIEKWSRIYEFHHYVDVDHEFKLGQMEWQAPDYEADPSGNTWYSKPQDEDISPLQDAFEAYVGAIYLDPCLGPEAIKSWLSLLAEPILSGKEEPSSWE